MNWHAKRMKLAAAVLACLMSVGASAASAETDWNAVGSALGKSGTAMPGGVYRIGLPRSDLKVVLDGVELKPTLALGSWVAFESMGSKTMVMGDLVLTEDEIEPVMSSLAQHDIQITALHNHLLRARPMTFYMHVLGEGDAVTLAKSLHEALSLTKTPMGGAPAAAPPPNIDLDTAAIDKALEAKGKIAGGVYQVNVPRAAAVTDHGMAVPVAMGSAEAINFQPTGAGNAATTGDFVLTSAEVNPVLRALRQNGIEVTALHNHMLNDEPRLFFMHFWANAPLPKLLEGLRAALAHVAVQHPAGK